MKKMYLLMALAVMALVLTGCPEAGVTALLDGVQVSDSVVRLSTTDSAMETKTVTVAAYDSDANEMTDRTYTWSSSDEAVATVADGVITAVGVGDAVVTVTTGDLSEEIEVLVREEGYPGRGIYTETWFAVGEPTLDTFAEGGAPTVGAAPGVVSPVDGSVALEVDFTPSTGGWEGIAWSFGSAINLTDYANGALVFYLDTTDLTAGLADLKVELADANTDPNQISTKDWFLISDITGGDVVGSTTWKKYEIPLAALGVIDYTQFTTLVVSGAGLEGSIYMDQVYFSDSHALTADAVGALYSEVSVLSGQTTQLNLYKYYSNGIAFVDVNGDPVVSDATISWASADTNIATVGAADGLVTAVGAGSTTVTATVGAATYDFTVNVVGQGVYSETYDLAGSFTAGSWSETDNNGGGVGVALSDVASPVVDGTQAKKADFTNVGAWGGFWFEAAASVDVSSLSSLVISMNTSEMTTLAILEFKVEDFDGGAQTFMLADLAGTATTNATNAAYTDYSIPLASITTANMTKFKTIGFWHPKDASEGILTGNLYFDNIYFAE